jgi:methanogenic corrinoid protein MtbC1
VKAFLADHEETVSPEPTVAPPTTELSPEQREARALALAGDVDGLVSLIANQRLKGNSLAFAFDRIIAPALYDIGEGWAQGKLSPAQEHIASNAVKDMLARVRPLVERTARADRGRALCACLGDEYHDIGVRMVSLVLAAEGYRTGLIGANVPVGDLALMVAGDAPALIALSSSPCANPEQLRGDLGVLASAATASKTKIIVGGSGFAKIASLPSQVKRYNTLEELAGVTLNG